MKDKKNTDKESQKEHLPTVTDHLLTAFMAYYQPAEATDPEAEPLTTNDIIDQMESIEEVCKSVVSSYLAANGFKISFSAAGPFWYVKPKS